MSKRIRDRILSTLVCSLDFVPIATAHEVLIRERAKVGDGLELEPGTYRVEVKKNQDSAEVLFFQGEELILTAPAIFTKVVPGEAGSSRNFLRMSVHLRDPRPVTRNV